MSIIKRLERIQERLRSRGEEGLYVSSFDIFLSEYVPLEDCPRYFITGFTGSVAEVLIPVEGRAQLFVDGRYYEQAHLEVDERWVEVVEVPYGTSLVDALVERIIGARLKNLGVLGPRTPLSLVRKLSSDLSIRDFGMDSFRDIATMTSFLAKGRVWSLSKDQHGEDTSEKLKRILCKNEGMFVTALDSLAWLSNLRGHCLPYQVSFPGVSFLCLDKAFIFVENSLLDSFSHLERHDISIHCLDSLEEVLLAQSENIEILYVDKENISLSLYETLEKSFGSSKISDYKGGLLRFHMLKNATEISEMKRAFDRSDRAIYKTIKWVKESSKGLSELDFYHKCNGFYKEEGAVCQSFKTIAAFAANSSIVHFSKPSEKNLYRDGELILLDSGAFYESGLATDTTRTFIGSGTASKQYQLIYTSVLRALLTVLNTTYKKGTVGSDVDNIARSVIKEAGFDYAHGTGHGVGVNVHEGGFSLTPHSTTPLREGTVGSVEPGIYLPEVGGVRLENIVHVVEVDNDHLGLESLVYIGYDYDLIDFSLFSEEEKKWFTQYEDECQKKGRSFKS